MGILVLGRLMYSMRSWAISGAVFRIFSNSGRHESKLTEVLRVSGFVIARLLAEARSSRRSGEIRNSEKREMSIPSREDRLFKKQAKGRASLEWRPEGKPLFQI